MYNFNSEYEKLSDWMQKLSLVDTQGKNTEDLQPPTKGQQTIQLIAFSAVPHSEYATVDVWYLVGR